MTITYHYLVAIGRNQRPTVDEATEIHGNSITTDAMRSGTGNNTNIALIRYYIIVAHSLLQLVMGGKAGERGMGDGREVGLK